MNIRDTASGRRQQVDNGMDNNEPPALSSITALQPMDPCPGNIHTMNNGVKMREGRGTSIAAYIRSGQTFILRGRTRKADCTYPIPYLVLNMTCPLIVRGTSRSIWISNVEGRSIESRYSTPSVSARFNSFADFWEVSFAFPSISVNHAAARHRSGMPLYTLSCMRYKPRAGSA
jgi:hypothetical protein